MVSQAQLRGLILALPLFCAAPTLRAADANDEALETLADLLQRLEGGAVSSVMRAYNRIEAGKRFNAEGRYSIHRGLLSQLQLMETPALTSYAEELLRKPSRSSYAAQVLTLKALLGDKFPATREQRAAWMRNLVTEKGERLAIWGARTLGDSRWKEAVEVLLSVMADEEQAQRLDGFVYNLVRGELYRLFGGRAAYAPAATLRKDWEKGGRELPAEPDYSVDGQASGSARTIAFFGDRISPRSVFCIDSSGSMEELATLRGSLASRRRTVAPGEVETAERHPKIQIVKDELQRALGGLQPAWKFNVLSYNTTVDLWRGKAKSPALVTARRGTVDDAKDWASRLAAKGKTNIHDTLVMALGMKGVETIYLLSDGSPSIGGGPDRIRAQVAVRNYLLGARIITYGFTLEGKGEFNEPLMKKLASENWGWYRRLN